MARLSTRLLEIGFCISANFVFVACNQDYSIYKIDAQGNRLGSDGLSKNAPTPAGASEPSRQAESSHDKNDAADASGVTDPTSNLPAKNSTGSRDGTPPGSNRDGTAPESDTFQKISQSFAVKVAEKKVDVLFVMDDSGSMAEEQKNVVDSFDTFLQGFVDMNVDYHIGLVTTDNTADPNAWLAPQYQDYSQDGAGSLLARKGNARFLSSALPKQEALRQFQQNVTMGIAGSGAETGILSLINTLSPERLATSGWNAGFVRTDALLSMIVVSDEDESNSPTDTGYIKANPTAKADRVKQFLDLVTSLKPNRPDLLRFDAVVAPSKQDCPTVGNSGGLDGTGDVYVEVAKALKPSNPHVLNICQNFAAALGNVGSELAVQVERRFALDKAPTGKVLVKLNNIDIAESSTNGFSYDPSKNVVQLNGLGLENMENFEVRVDYSVLARAKN